MNISNKGKVSFSWWAGIIAEYGTRYDTGNQVVTNANSWYVVHFSHEADAYGMYLWAWGTGLYVSSTGDYEFFVSAIADTDTVNKHVYVWFRKNGVDVPDSNTIVQLPSASTETVVAVSIIIDMNAWDYMQIMYGSDDNGSQLVYTAAWVSPTRPACPSIIVTGKKIWVER